MAELTYRQEGEYLIPNIKLTVTEQRPLGKYGMMRRTFLQEHRRMLYSDLVLTEKLFPHLWEVQDTAERRVKEITEALLKKNPAPDKRTDQMGWVAHMNSLKAQAEEIVIAELINS